MPSTGYAVRAFGYIRVSEAREGMISPEIQQDEVSRYCIGKGWTVLEWFRDLDISGRTDKRPALQEMIRRAQDGECDVVVFYRIDRLSREPMHHYAILHALREAGVGVDSVGLPADGTAEGEFMWDLSAALAKLESLRHGKRIRDAHRRMRGPAAGAVALPLSVCGPRIPDRGSTPIPVDRPGSSRSTSGSSRAGHAPVSPAR